MQHFLVDHLPHSRSTHRNWWRHIRDGLRACGESVAWIAPKARKVRGPANRRVFWVFTESSMTDSLVSAVRSEDVVLTWQGQARWREVTPYAFMLGYPGDGWKSDWVAEGGDPEALLTFQPFAPLAALDGKPPGPPRCELAFFGSVWDGNVDHFEQILEPLAASHSHHYRGLAYGAPTSARKLGFSRLQVSERRGWRALRAGRVNLAIAHSEHRRKRSVTERVFISAALGRPVVADNLGVESYFGREEMRAFEDPAEYIEYVEWLLRNPDEAAAIADRARTRTLARYTYKETVGDVLSQLAAKLSS